MQTKQELFAFIVVHHSFDVLNQCRDHIWILQFDCVAHKFQFAANFHQFRNFALFKLVVCSLHCGTLLSQFEDSSCITHHGSHFLFLALQGHESHFFVGFFFSPCRVCRHHHPNQADPDVHHLQRQPA